MSHGLVFGEPQVKRCHDVRHERNRYVCHLRIEVRFGAYRAIAYNYDTETILYRNMSSWQTLEAYTRYSSIEEGAQIATRDAMPRASGAENEPVILEPDPLWAGAGEPVKVIDGEPATTTVVPSSRTKTVEIDIYHVPNLQYTSQLGGALSGLAPGVKVATREQVEDGSWWNQATPGVYILNGRKVIKK